MSKYIKEPENFLGFRLIDRISFQIKIQVRDNKSGSQDYNLRF
jgi:hypothetical protein